MSARESLGYMTSFTSDNIPPVGNPTTGFENAPVNVSEEYFERRFSRLLRSHKDISYEFTHDPALLHQYYRLREEMFSNVWGLKHFSGKQDSFDSSSQIMVARKGLQCIGGGRLTISTPENRQLLPMEKDDLLLSEMFPELDLPETTYGEFSRLAILPEFRGGVIFPEIARRFIRKAIAHGVEYAFNIAPVPLARSYRQAVQLFGLKWDICHNVKVPQRDEYEGIQMTISVMDLSLQVRNLRNARKSANSDRKLSAE